jgi:tetratricopeptide (TPR) repeat protein
MPRLSVCLIVKNEERHLARCLQSVRGLADEVIVVDTGSTDGTIAIAQAHGARVCHFTWQDDFSLAKNFSIEQATGDWILSIDGDESIAQRDHDVIRRVLRRDDVDAAIAAQRHYLSSDTTWIGWRPGSGGYEEGEPYPGFVDVDCRRLFRNVPWLRFRNRVHEELVSTDSSRPLREQRGAWVIHHYGKLGGRDILRAKGEAYLRIGIRKVEDQPQDPQAHFELGVQYAELNEPAAAIPCFERALALSPVHRDAQLRVALCYLDLQDYRQSLAALRLSARTLPGLAADIALAEGNAHRGLGDERAAEQAFRRALGVNPGLAAASFNLALLYQRQGRSDDAIACLGRALEHAPAHTEMRLLRGRIRWDRGDDAAALEDFEGVETDERAFRWRARILARQRRFAQARHCLAALGDKTDSELSSLRGAVALAFGELDEAVAQLRSSMEQQATAEAAMNLSIACEARGDRQAALAAAAEALRLAPSDRDARGRFAQLSREELGVRASESQTLTIFFHQPFSVSCDGNTPRTRGLGGTESAIVYLAESLVRRGHRCVVLNNCAVPVQVNGVEYARWETLPVRCVNDRPDVVVAVRFWETIGRTRFAPLQIFWTGDAFDQPFVETLAGRDARAEIDLFMLQSDWQIETFHAHHQVPMSQIVRTTLGAAATAAVPALRPSSGVRARRLVYASTPFRGLEGLLDVFPRIRAACPDAELDVFSSMQVYGVSEADDKKQFDALYRKARQPGVTLVGTVPQMELAARLQQARVLAYPNHYAETFCIAAVEAQAAGCAVVTSSLGALPETVGGAGVCIPGDPRSASYQRQFVDACVALLLDDERWMETSERAVAQAAASYSWPVIAEHWDTVCRAALAGEPAEMERIAVHLASGRAPLARRMLGRASKPEAVHADVWSCLEAFVAWHAGDGAAPAEPALRQLALYFRSLRRAGVIDAALQASSLQPA